jgi:hypothetical protein
MQELQKKELKQTSNKKKAAFISRIFKLDYILVLIV